MLSDQISNRESDTPEIRSGLRKNLLRITLVLAMANLLAFLDRSNISYAALTMNAQLGIDAAMFGLVLSAFQIGYVIFDVPSSYGYTRFGLSVWLGRIMVSWGLVSALMLFAVGPNSLIALRFLLGAAEAGFITGAVLLTRAWFPQSHTARALGLCFLANPVAGILGGPLSVGIQTLNGTAGLTGWQWLFLLEGLPSVLMGLAMWLILKDHPKDGTWLSERERAALIRTLEAEADERARRPLGQLTFVQALMTPRILLLAVGYAGSLLPIIALNNWTPLIVKDLGFSNTATGFLATLPQVSGFLGTFVLTRLADSMTDKRLLLGIALAISAVGFLVMPQVTSPIVKLAALSVAGFSIYAANPIFWAIPSGLLGRAAGGAGVAMISAIGTLGTVVGQSTIGYLRQSSGSFNSAVFFVAASTLAGAVLIYAFGRSTGPSS